jgi:DNA-binding MarR family transcriptional regulator
VSYSYTITDTDYRSLAEVRYQIRRFLHFSERAARATGIEPQQHQLLLAVRGLDQPSISVLAERLQIQHHSAVELVDRLAERGLVLRSRAPSDRRQVLVQLTPRGEAELEKLAACHMAELRENGPALVNALEAVIRRVNGGN